MDAQLKKFLYGTATLALLIVAMIFVIPMISARSGKFNAEAFWAEEERRNNQRLFGGDDAL